MRAVQTVGDLELPYDYRECISEYIQNLSRIPFISRVILFGSCAEGTVKRFSDIDIFIIANREITKDEEVLVMAYCYPEHAVGKIPMDIIVQPESVYSKHVETLGMVQQQVNEYGVDLSGLLRQRTEE